VRGRPFKSDVRKKIEGILATVGTGHGYQIYKIYRQAYGKATLRNIYYHLQTGVRLREFIEAGSEETDGSYTWGPKAEIKLYALGPNASQGADAKVQEAMKALSIRQKSPEKSIAWQELAKETWELFLKDMEKAKTQTDLKKLMEEYGRIRAWLGKHDDPAEREKVEKKLSTIGQ